MPCNDNTFARFWISVLFVALLLLLIVKMDHEMKNSLVNSETPEAKGAHYNNKEVVAVITMCWQTWQDIPKKCNLFNCYLEKGFAPKWRLMKDGSLLEGKIPETPTEIHVTKLYEV
jgi:hypothetical protein